MGRRSTARKPSSLHSSFLTIGTVMGAPLGDDDALDRCAATTTGLALLMVDVHVVVVVAGLTPQVAIVVEGCPSMLNPSREDRDDALLQQCGFVLTEAISPPPRMDVCVEEGLIRVDIAYAG